MEAAVARALERFGTIDGVIHAALVLDDGPMQTKSREAASRVLAPKVAGTLVLKEVLAGRDLDFFVIFSSLVSVLGGRGQVDYCAASAFQDAFAHAERSGLAQSVMSVNWGAWDEVGMAARAARQRGGWPEETLPLRMSRAEGLDAFMRALASPHAQVLVSPQGPAVLSASRASATARPAAPVDAAPAAAVPPSPDQAPAGYLDPRTGTERVIAGIWQEVLGIERVGADDNFFDLGGDSIISLQFIAKAKKAGLRFTNRQVFEYQTVARLAAAVPAGEPAQVN
jgi:NAD(P)-dependent dehydrogenase (short-subunit alcohol dehydrogenase family)